MPHTLSLIPPADNERIEGHHEEKADRARLRLSRGNRKLRAQLPTMKTLLSLHSRALLCRQLFLHLYVDRPRRLLTSSRHDEGQTYGCDRHLLFLPCWLRTSSLPW